MDKRRIEIIEAHQPAALAALREEWDALLSLCKRATIYQTWEWNDAWWNAFHQGKRLRLLEARVNGRLVGIAPLYVSRHLGTPLRRLAFIGTGASDYMDIIAQEENAEDVCVAVLRYLGASRSYDLADLQQLSPDALLKSFHSVRSNPAQTHTLITQEPCPYVALPSRWEDYTASLGKKMRSNLAYYDRLLPRTFPDTSIHLAEKEQIDEAMSALFDLHQKRWNARLLPGVLGADRVQKFHRMVAERFAARGWLRLHMTELQGRIVAALYCFQYRARYYYYLGGFAPDLGKYSLGTVLTAHAMRHAISEGCADFDFLRGNEPYKYRWQPEERYNQRLILGRSRSLRFNTMLRLNRLERIVEHRAKEFAERRGRK